MKKPVSIVLNGTTPRKITFLRHWIPAFAGMTNRGHYRSGNDDVESVGVTERGAEMTNWGHYSAGMTKENVI